LFLDVISRLWDFWFVVAFSIKNISFILIKREI
jgi:hypothetical protein